MKKFLPESMLLAACVLWLPLQGTATQEAPKAERDLTAEEIIEKSIEALGGKQALEKVKTRHSKGTCEFKGMGAKGSFESFEKAPNRSWAVIDLPGFGEAIQAYDGKIGWSKDPTMGLRELEGPELQTIKRDSVFNAELRWKEIYKEAKSNGKKKVEGKDVYEVEMIANEGKPVTVYYDAETFLPFLRKSVLESPQGTFPIKVFSSDYKAVDGVKIPHSVRQVAGPGELILTLQEVKHNLEIDDKKFAKPADEDEEEEKKPEEPKKP